MSDIDDWKQRFRVPVIGGTAIASREPSRGLALSNRSGVVQACGWDVETGQLQEVTELPTGLRFAYLDPTGDSVYFLRDDHGNELGHLARVPWGGGDDVDLTPDDDPYALVGVMVSRDGGVLGFTTATRSGFDTVVAASTAAPGLVDRRLVFHATALSRGPLLSANGAIAVIATAAHSGSTDMDLVAVDTTSGDQITAWIEPDTHLSPVGFAPIDGDQRLLLGSNSSGFVRPVVWDPTSGEQVEPGTSGFDGELTPLGWNADGSVVLLRHIVAATTQLCSWHLGSGELVRLPHDPSYIAAAYYGADNRVVAEVQDSTSPTRVIEVNPNTAETTRVLLASGDAPAGRPWRSVTFRSTDDALIQAWVGEPDGAGPFPTIIDAHGGPTAAQFDQWSAAAQAWTDHGYAFMSVNYRGSTTFGHEFEASIRGDLGRREVDDLAAGRRWMIDEGISDPGRVFVGGWSYGGYLTLLSLGLKPDLWAGGLAGIAIADWTLMYEDEAESLRQYGVALFGGTPEELPDVYAKSSPITYAHQVQAPVLIIQGSNDTRCPARQLRAYKAQMQALDKSIQVEWFEAGHGSYDSEQRIGFQELMMQFADNVLVASANREQ